MLDTLDLLLNNNPVAQKTALDNNGIELAVLFEHPSAEIRVSAGAVLAQMAEHSQCKTDVLNHRSDILLTLTQLLNDQVDVK